MPNKNTRTGAHAAATCTRTCPSPFKSARRSCIVVSSAVGSFPVIALPSSLNSLMSYAAMHAPVKKTQPVLGKQSYLQEIHRYWRPAYGTARSIFSADTHTHTHTHAHTHTHTHTHTQTPRKHTQLVCDTRTPCQNDVSTQTHTNHTLYTHLLLLRKRR